MSDPVYRNPPAENDPFLAALAKLDALYTKTPGGPHARLVQFQRDMFDLCVTGRLVPVRGVGHIQYHLAGRVPEALRGQVLTLDELADLHAEQLRISATRWN